MSELERKIAQIIAGVLQREKVDLEEDFLDLGGDSLAAMLCISRIRDMVGTELTIEDFFLEIANVRSLASRISLLQERKASLEPPSLSSKLSAEL